jgi:2-dehydropantoate 2-reductase
VWIVSPRDDIGCRNQLFLPQSARRVFATPVSRIAIIGAGAIGSVLGARLHQAGHDVLLIARGDRLRSLRLEGLRLSACGVAERARVSVAESLVDAAPPDHVIVATKTFQLPAALRLLSRYGNAPLSVLTVQNGVESAQCVQIALPRAMVVTARMHGFFELEKDIVYHAGVPPSIVMGPDQSGFASPLHHRKAAELAAALDRSGIPTEFVDDARPALWDKFLMAATIGGLAPAVGLTVGQVSLHSEACALLRLAMDEVAAIATALGISLPAGCVAEKLAFIRRFPPEATSSLQRDLEAHRPSEFAHLTGAIPRFAAGSGVPAPTADKIIAMLRGRGLLAG